MLEYGPESCSKICSVGICKHVSNCQILTQIHKKTSSKVSIITLVKKYYIATNILERDSKNWNLSCRTLALLSSVLENVVKFTKLL